MDQWWIIMVGWLALEKKPQGSLNRGAWRWKDRVQGKVRALQFHPSSFVSHLYLPPIPTCPAFHHSVVLFSPLLSPPFTILSKLTIGFHMETIQLLRCFPFSIIPASSSKRGLGEVGHKTLNHRHEEYTLQGQQFFDHSLALSAKKLRGRFIWSVLSKQWNCVNTAKKM